MKRITKEELISKNPNPFDLTLSIIERARHLIRAGKQGHQSKINNLALQAIEDAYDDVDPKEYEKLPKEESTPIKIDNESYDEKEEITKK